VNSFLSFFAQSIGFLRQAVKRRFRQWTKPVDNTLVLSTILAVTRSKSELVLENALLRQQLTVLRRQIKRPKLSWRDRTLIILLASKLRFWKQALVIVRPDTVLRWHRDLFRRVWRRKSKPKKKPGRPPLTGEVVALIKQMARHPPMAEKTAPGARNAFGVNCSSSGCT
jgi:putative transposase